MRGKFFLDLDDTLIPTMCHYTNAKNTFANFILDKFKGSNLTSENINKMIIDREFKLIKKVGFNAEVFPQSLKYVYKKIAEESGEDSRKIVNGCKRAYRIGKSVFDEEAWKKAGLYSGAEDVLDFLVNSGDDLYMITLGDSRMQRKKIEVMGLDKWFPKNNIYVDLREKSSSIRDISSTGHKDDIWFIGNSYNSDIRPALNSGIGAIYIPNGNCLWDGAPGKNHDKMIRLENILGIKDIYNSHLRRRD